MSWFDTRDMQDTQGTQNGCDCGQGDFVTDVSSGDVVCRGCGVVVEAHIFEERLECYSEQAGPRAGPTKDAWLLPAQPVVFDAFPARRRILCNADPHTSIRELFSVIEMMGRTYSKDVQDTAKLLCRDLASKRTVRADCRHVYAASALYLAAKMHGRGIGRSKKEVAAEFQMHGVTERGITVTAKLFKGALHSAAYSGQLFSGLDAADLINRCVDRLDLDGATRKEVKRCAHVLAERVPEREVEGKTPCSICSGVVACVLQQLDVKMSKKHLVECCRVSGATLDKMARAVREWTSAA